MKDPFAQLDVDFKTNAENMDEAQLRDTIAKVALAQASLQEAKEQDMDLASKKEIAREAGAQYRDGSKQNKLRISYCRELLKAKGKDIGEVEME